MAQLFSGSYTYPEAQVPYVYGVTGNPDGSETVTFRGTDPGLGYTYTINITDAYGDVHIHEGNPSAPDFSGNDYYGILTAYSNGGDYTVQNNSEDGSPSSFTWLFTSAVDTTGFVTLYPDGKGGPFVPPACYAEGSRIATARGEAAVEALHVADLVVTASGEHRPIKWIGHRRLDLTKHPDPRAVWPVRVTVGAFGEGLPKRDLWMSPGHNVFVNGVLIAIKHLINGATVVQVSVDTVTYWHVELDSHDVILAEGLPAESYLDTGNRTAFENGGAFLNLYPDFEPKHWAKTCAPIVKSGPEVEAAKAGLLARAQRLGNRTTSAPDLHIMADGRRIEPIDLGGKRFAFYLPAACRAIALTSRAFVPAHVRARSTDDRVLGIAIKQMRIDGELVDLQTMAAPGWHKPEEHPSHVRRWTTGSAALPPGARLVTVDVASEGRYWVEHQENEVALRA